MTIVMDHGPAVWNLFEKNVSKRPHLAEWPYLAGHRQTGDPKRGDAKKKDKKKRGERVSSSL